MRRVPDGRDLEGEDILMDGQTGNKKLPKDHTQVDIPMDGFDLPGEYILMILYLFYKSTFSGFIYFFLFFYVSFTFFSISLT